MVANAEKVDQLTELDNWNMDGNYSSTMKHRFERADAIIFIDVSRIKSLYGIFKRRWQYRKVQRKDMPQSWKEKISWEFLVFVLRYNCDRRKNVYDLLSQVEDQLVFIISDKSSREVCIDSLDTF